MTEARLRQDALRCVLAGIAAVDPERLTAQALAGGEGGTSGGGDHPVTLLAVGKAAPGMARGALEVLGRRVSAGVVLLPRGTDAGALPPVLDVRRGAHPLPDASSVEGARALLRAARAGAGRGPLLVLLSGGASSLLTLPPDDVTLEEVRGTTDALLRAGATIGELNAVRKHLDSLKGGGLAREVARASGGAGAAAGARARVPATVLVLVLSDVVGDPLDVVASGPLAPDPTTFADALRVLRRHGLLPGVAREGDPQVSAAEAVPHAVVRRLEAGAAGRIPETPAPGDPCFAGVTTLVVGNARLAAEAAAREAARLGYAAEVRSLALAGEAREAGRRIARELAGSTRRAEGAAPDPRARHRPACRVWAGETTVTVRGPGRGGRNQELALAAALELAGTEGVVLVSAGTDGVDGPTNAAGAVATGSTVARARAAGLEPEAALDRNDSHTFFAALGDLLVTGPTGTNVMDLQVGLVGPPPAAD